MQNSPKGFSIFVKGRVIVHEKLRYARLSACVMEDNIAFFHDPWRLQSVASTLVWIDHFLERRMTSLILQKILSVKEHCFILSDSLVVFRFELSLESDFNFNYCHRGVGFRKQNPRSQPCWCSCIFSYLLLGCNCGNLSKVPWEPFSQGPICWETPERPLSIIMFEYISKLVIS